MAGPRIHRFERDGRRFAIDPETCFCFECDEISWDVLEHYPANTVNRIYALLGDKHDVKELGEVISELEWLRATKSILREYTPEEMQESFKPARGLNAITIHLANDSLSHITDGLALLMGRSEANTNLQATLILDAKADIKKIAEVAAQSARIATVAGKQLTMVFRAAFDAVPKAPESIAQHIIAFEAETASNDIATLSGACAWAMESGGRPLAKSAKAIGKLSDTVCRVSLQPSTPNFGEAPQVLHEAGFNGIALDLESAYASHPEIAPENMVRGLHEAANYYANCLLKGDYFRLDPIADLFRRIYEGTPLRRADGTGTQSLAIAADGSIYPGTAFVGNGAFRVGNLDEGTFEESVRAPFEDLGVPTTGPCRRCWARHLCGGGHGAIHHARSGHIHQPDEAWCDAQRAWYTGAVSAFNILSSHGVNFTRMYQNLSPAGGKPSIFKMMRAAVNMTVAIRPVEESDAPMLVQWENWTEAAYFLNTEGGLLMATEYDREMNALHPTAVEQEMLLTRRSGEAIGLLRLRPARESDTAWAWLFLRNPDDYAASDIQRGLKLLIGEAAKGQGIRRVMIRAMASETGLQSLLESLGFTQAGIEREAIYLHSEYQDLHVYQATFG